MRTNRKINNSSYVCGFFNCSLNLVDRLIILKVKKRSEMIWLRSEKKIENAYLGNASCAKHIK